MTSISVGDEFDYQWSLAASRPLLCELGGLVNSEDVHTVDLGEDDDSMRSADWDEQRKGKE